MSAWKSPLLYLGFVLIAIAAAALVAPLFVDWDTYRAEFEDYGRKLTGRDVKIAGSIEARLFPWPALVLNEVNVANPDGTLGAHLMEAERIEVGMSLAPLMSGRIEVDTIAIDGPVFAFERLASGAVSWAIEPDRSLPALIDPERVAVSEIAISNGTVFAGDHRRDGLTRIDALSGTLSAPALNGPWRMRATASHAGVPFEINLSTGKIVSGEATRVALRLSPVENAGAVYSFDGEIARPEGKSLKGAIKVTPTRSERGKDDAETGLPRFEVKADIEADFDAVTLTKIEASPAFSTDPGNFITGAAQIDLGSRVDVEAALSTARIDLDQIAGRRGRDLMRSPDALEQLGLFLERMPNTLDLHVDLAAAGLVVGGEMLDASRLKFELSPERLRIDEFTTGMPGQTRARFSGLLLFGQGAPLMSGDISLESVSLRDFVMWALRPDQQRALGEVWHGSRGRLALEAKLDLTTSGVRLSEVEAMLDEARVTGSLSSRTGPEEGLALRIAADTFDLDRYLPRGLGEWAGQGVGESGLAVTLVDFARQAMTFGDFQLTAQAGDFRFHGVRAEDVAIDVGASADVLELRTVEIGEVGGARLDVAGLVSFPGEGVAGSINAAVDAEDPRALLRLLGAIGPEESLEPAWAEALGPLDAKLIAEASAEEHVTTATMALTGTAGGASASIEGRFRGEPANWQEGEVDLAGEMDARTSALLAAVTGLELDERSDRPTRLAGSIAGTLRGGLDTMLEAELFGAGGQFIGTIVEGRRTIEAHGRVAVLAEDAAELFAIAGVPGDDRNPTPQVLAAESEVTYDGRGLRLSTLRGNAGGSAFRGDLNFVAEPVRRVTGEIATDNLSLPWLLGAVLLPRDGNPHALSSHFASAVPSLEAEVTIAADRLLLLPHVTVESSELELDIGRFEMALSGRGNGPDGEPATGSIEIVLDRRGAVLEGTVAGPVDLGALLQAGDGSSVIDAGSRVELTFSGRGRSPAGVLAGLQADGSYEVTRGVLRRVDPASLARDLAAAKRPSEIDGLFSASLRGGDMAFTGGRGSLTVVDGVLKARPLAILGEGTTGEARFLLEAASGRIDLSFTLSLAEQHTIPSFEVAYAGSPRALETSIDAQSLRSYLSMQMLQDSVQQLEELQRQEQELIEEEERFQREQEQREQERREAERREQERLEQEQREAERLEADRELDRKQRELADRLRAEERQVELRTIEGRKADRRDFGDRVPETGGEPQAGGEPEASHQAVPGDMPERRREQPEPAAARSEAARSDALVVAPLDAPADAPADAPLGALPEPDTPLEGGRTTSALRDPVPLPRLKPEPDADAARSDTPDAPLRLPLSGNLGRILEPVFSGPKVLQPDLTPPEPARTRLGR